MARGARVGSVALAETLRAELAARPELDRIYREIERPLTPVLARMEIAGVAIDVPFLRETSARMERAAARARAEDLGRGGRGVQRQLARQARADPLREARLPGPEEDGQDEVLLDRRRGLERARRARLSRCRSSSSSTARSRSSREPTSTPCRRSPTPEGASTPPSARPSPPRAASPPPTRTCRTSPSAPRRAGRSARAFIAPPGRKLVVADYSQIELRILAHISGDQNLIDAFERGDDIHRATAARIFSVAPDLVSSRDALRRQADQLRAPLRNGRLHARQGPRRLDRRRRRPTWTPTSISSRRCAGVSTAFSRRRGRRARSRTIFGRVRPIPDIAASNGTVRGNAERMALNAPFQGSAADIIKIAMIRLDRGARPAAARSRG